MKIDLYAAVAKTAGLIGVMSVIASFWLGLPYVLHGLALILISGLMRNDYQMMPIVNQHADRLAALENENHRLRKALGKLEEDLVKVASGQSITLDRRFEELD